ncbi:protein IN2-1 homolog B-like [Triticum aestivum]|uniref:protein IN2-1 homolog B-like n=1 Tax=Triticum aestivum TaxID=4565 RepID=UPI001D014357|nr:protein IN2-1 homolog B-like [Triticum aestivum]
MEPGLAGVKEELDDAATLKWARDDWAQTELQRQRLTYERIRSSAGEDHPADLTSASSEPPPLFDGTSGSIGLQDTIKIVALDLADRPAWYKDKVYTENKVPALEHNKQVIGESLDLLKYIDNNFDGPALLPHDSAKKQFAEELLAYSDSFNASAFFSCLRSKGDVTDEAGKQIEQNSATYNMFVCFRSSTFKGCMQSVLTLHLLSLVTAVDKIEAALGKFSDGPFFLGQFSLVDIAYVPFIERLQISYSGIKNYDIVGGRPNLGSFIEVYSG